MINEPELYMEVDIETSTYRNVIEYLENGIIKKTTIHYIYLMVHIISNINPTNWI